MTATQYRAKISHTEDTIQRLYRTRYFLYEKPRILFRASLGFALVLVAALTGLPIWAKALLLLFGAWFLVSWDFPASVGADRALTQRKAALPKMEYAFGPEKLRLTGEGAMDIPYGKIARLTEDRDYFYLFLSRESVCMMQRDSVQPPQIPEFRKFLEDKTGLTWREAKPFLSMSVYELRQNFREGKKK